jgi:hypothetical protein
MFNILFEFYNMFSDTRPGAGITLMPDKTLGKTVGNERSLGDIYDKYYIDDESAEEDEDPIVDDASLEAIGNKLYQPVYSIDRKRSDASNTSGNRRMTGGLNEIEHTNPIRKNSIAPYKQRKFDGPPIGSGNANNMIRTGPGRKSGTVFGYSRAPIVIDNDPLMFGEKPKDKMELSFLRQQNKIKKLRKLVKDIEKDQNK